MKAASGQLATILAGNDQLQMADLYTVTLRDNTVYRWSNREFDLVVGGNTFSGLGPLIKRGKIRETVGLEVDTLEITLERGDTLTFVGSSFPLAAASGAFDGATVQVERLFVIDWNDTSAGTIVRFIGQVSTVKPSSTRIVLQVKSDLEKLTTALPRTVCEPQCTHALYDAGCGLSRATFTVTGTATGTPTTTTVPSARAEASGYFVLGVITMTSGAAIGQKRMVKAFASGLFTVAIPFTVAPAAGDTFSAYPGCDKLQATCNAKFSNLTRYRGFPYVPKPETAR